KKFLEFFFKRIRINDTGRYEKEFPYISPCGRERNYIRCDDTPIVYTHIIEKSNDDGQYFLSYGHAADLLIRLFEPNKLCMFPESGRVYHPADERVGGVGLVKSSLAIELSKYFSFEAGSDQMPTHFTWKEEKHRLTQE
ncbi:UPF0598 protein CG30010-like, partial [Centruroides sculpturatus]|uniref:UPF0598 protein CG30010-like n=1 Tax=Centruroides sculpturatus TaxID=218467 RepID=UPI000C6CAF8F